MAGTVQFSCRSRVAGALVRKSVDESLIDLDEQLPDRDTAFHSLTSILKPITFGFSAKGASSPRKGPCPPSIQSRYESSFLPDLCGLQANVERSFVCSTKNSPRAPTSSSTKNKPKTWSTLFRRKSLMRGDAFNGTIHGFARCRPSICRMRACHSPTHN